MVGIYSTIRTVKNIATAYRNSTSLFIAILVYHLKLDLTPP